MQADPDTASLHSMSAQTPQRAGWGAVPFDSAPKTMVSHLGKRQFQDVSESMPPPLRQLGSGPSLTSEISAPSIASLPSSFAADRMAAPTAGHPCDMNQSDSRYIPAVAAPAASACSVESVPASLEAMLPCAARAAKQHPFVPHQECVFSSDGYPSIKIGPATVPLRDDCDRRPGDPKFNPRVVALSDSVLKVPPCCPRCVVYFI
jgi:hypothetical protein